MFCSKCGKTLDPGQLNCPHCGQALGQSRMSGHTSVQPRYVPAESTAEPSRYSPYTKTTYTSMDTQGDDVYSRTAYRPVLPEQDAKGKTSSPDDVDEADERADGVEAEGADGAPEADGDTASAPAPKIARIEVPTGEISPHQKEALSKLQEVPADAPPPDEAERILKNQDIRLDPVKPIRKTGISPEVEGYIQRMEAMKNKGRRRKGDDEGETDAEVDNLVGTVANAGVLGDDADDRAARKAERARQKALKPRSPAMKWAMRIATVLLIAVVLVGGVIYVALQTQPTSPIPGVGKDLFDAGVELIKTRVSTEYRQKMTNLFKEDPSGSKALAQQAADAKEITDLLPEKPQENDARFIETLGSIQKSVDAASATEMLAELAVDPSVRAQQSQQAQEQWDIINNYVSRLSTQTTDIEDLRNINDGVKDVMATPTPTATPEPSDYKLLKKGDRNKQVKALQTRLAELGWFTSNTDGQYGTITNRAVKMFQQAAGLEVTGIATPEIQEAIYAENAPRHESMATPKPANALDVADEDVK